MSPGVLEALAAAAGAAAGAGAQAFAVPRRPDMVDVVAFEQRGQLAAGRARVELPASPTGWSYEIDFVATINDVPFLLRGAGEGAWDVYDDDGRREVGWTEIPAGATWMLPTFGATG